MLSTIVVGCQTKTVDADCEGCIARKECSLSKPLLGATSRNRGTNEASHYNYIDYEEYTYRLRRNR